jgi:hypothetical protein
MEDKNTKVIIDKLSNKSVLKQVIYQVTLKHFMELKSVIGELVDEISPEVRKKTHLVEIFHKEKGAYESELRFGSDTLIFSMHTNVFSFPQDSVVLKSDYVKANPTRAYCGIINVYNFLTDSVKYNRLNDVGYLIARIFVNYEGHFFIQGRRQFSFLYDDFSTFQLSRDMLKLILQQCILYSIDFDLYTPPYEAVKTINLGQKVMQGGTSALKTGKRLGFNLEDDDE